MTDPVGALVHIAEFCRCSRFLKRYRLAEAGEPFSVPVIRGLGVKPAERVRSAGRVSPTRIRQLTS